MAGAGWVYTGALILGWIFMRLGAERWWIGTMLLYGPRWLWAIPLPPLILAAAFLRPRSLGVLAVAAYIVLWPIMDLCVPWRWLKTIPPSILTLRVLTCNVHEDALDAGAMAGLIEHTHPDVVALQECDSYVAREVFRQTRWNLVADRELWLASRYPIRLVGILPENGPEANHSVADRCQIMTPAGVVTFYNLHLISPHGVFSDTLHLRPGAAAPLKGNINLRLREATELAGDVRSAGGPVVLAGDFNLPSDSAAYSQTFAAFTDAFSQVGFGFGWTYRVRWTTTRIDHILSTGGIVPRRCWVAGDVGSPHRPLIADLEWVKN